MRLEESYYLGKITRKHGLKGELVCILDTDSFSLYKSLKLVWLDMNGILTPFNLNVSRISPKAELIALFDYVDSDFLIGKSMYLPLSELPVLDGNRFYFHEIINQRFLDVNSQTKGIINQVLDYPNQTLLEVKTGNQSVIVPLVDDWDIQWDRLNKCLTMALPDGLIELNNHDSNTSGKYDE